MPEGDAILVIWFKLICLAGSTNDAGFVYLTEEIPFNTETLSVEFGKPLQTIKLALTTFQQFGMIEIIDDFIKLSNWERYQNVDGLEKIREQTRKRVAKHRAKKALEQKENVTLHVTHGNATDIEEDIDIDIDKDISSPLEKDDIPFKEIIDYLNQQAKKQFRPTTAKNKELIRARWSEGFRLDDFKKVIDNKVAEWLNDEHFNQYIRPITLFGTKFESYLNQDVSKKKNGSIEEDHEREQRKAFIEKKMKQRRKLLEG